MTTAKEIEEADERVTKAVADEVAARKENAEAQEEAAKRHEEAAKALRQLE